MSIPAQFKMFITKTDELDQSKRPTCWTERNDAQNVFSNFHMYVVLHIHMHAHTHILSQTYSHIHILSHTHSHIHNVCMHTYKGK